MQKTTEKKTPKIERKEKEQQHTTVFCCICAKPVDPCNSDTSTMYGKMFHKRHFYGVR